MINMYLLLQKPSNFFWGLKVDVFLHAEPGKKKKKKEVAFGTRRLELKLYLCDIEINMISLGHILFNM